MELFKLYGSIMIKNDEAEKSIQKTDQSAHKLLDKFDQTALGSTKLGKSISNAFRNSADSVSKFASNLGINIPPSTALIAGVGVAAAGAAVLVAKSGFDMTKKFADQADAIDKASQKIGISTDMYQKLSYAMGQSGIDIGVMQNGAKTMKLAMDDLASGNENAADKFEKIGISSDFVKDNLNNTDAVLKEVLLKLSEMPEGAERSAAAVELLGKSGTELAPLLNEGSAGIEELMNKAEELGIVIDEDAVKAGAKLNDTFDDIKKSAGTVGTGIAIELLPYVQGFSDFLLTNMPTIKSVVGDILGFVFGLITGGIDIITAFWNATETLRDIFISSVQTMKDITEPIINSILKGFKALLETIDALSFGLTDFSGAYSDMQWSDFNKTYLSKDDKVQYHANGGILSSGTHIVGEKGAELINMVNGKAVVTPLANQNSTFGSSHITLNINMDEIRQVEDLIRIITEAKQLSRMGADNL